MNETQAAYDKLVASIFAQAAHDLVWCYKKAERIERRKGDAWERDLISVRNDIRFLERWMRDVLPEWLEIDPEVIITECKRKAAHSASK